MRAADFDYELPPNRIAQQPVEPRDSSRLMVVDRALGSIRHRRFRDLPELLSSGDLLVANDSRVIPAKLHGRKEPYGGEVEVLLLRRLEGERWHALVRGRVRPGTRLVFEPTGAASLGATVAAVHTDGTRTLQFDAPLEPRLAAVGDVPLPPYIKAPLDDPERYQTVYARIAGSVAAPTAGLHFTPPLLDRLAGAGVGMAFITLHVGLDTFRPLDGDNVAQHKIHSEWAHVPHEAASAILEARRAGHRCIAIGTTCVRALESAARPMSRAGAADGPPAPFEGWTDLYITPGHEFQQVDAMITNFHLPRTTLLVLVAAFTGKAILDRAYREAIDHDYRFYSFGDAMLIL